MITAIEVQEIREKLKLTQQEMAEKLGLKHGVTICRWERGKVVPSRLSEKAIRELLTNSPSV